MTNEVIKEQLTTLFPEATFEEGGEWVNMFVAPEALVLTAATIRQHPGLGFDYLFCLTCIDWKTHLTMVYHFSSTTYRHQLVIKSKLDSTNPAIDTLCSLWPAAELFEREVYELFGVHFNNHPDLRKLILPDDWEGYPLRKNYEDPINMIKL
jgi:NADH:ubiquinone oxidoreductase subunit C